MSRRRALVVEDAPAGRMLVSALLTQQGFAVRETGDGEAGVAAAREEDRI